MKPIAQTTKHLCQISAQFRVGLALICVTEIALPRSSGCPQSSHLFVDSGQPGPACCCEGDTGWLLVAVGVA